MTLKITFSFLLALLLTETNLAVQPMRPGELDTLNYTQVLFQWHAQMNAEGYHLQTALAVEYDPFDEALIHDIDTPTNAVILLTGFDWGESYVWRYWLIDGDGNAGDTSFTHRFSTISLPDSLPEFEIEVSDRDRIQPGITLFRNTRRYVTAVDVDGNMKMIMPGGGEIEQLINGDFLSLKRGHIFQTNLDGDTIYYSPQGGMHHDINMLPNGNYLSLGKTYRWVPTPGGEGDSLLWEGDIIVEVNTDGDTLWSWDSHDYFSYEDYEPANLENAAEEGIHDWTHANACHSTPDMSAIYISVRHLSRITLIDYESREVIWNMGKEFPSGQVDFGHDLNFSYQHDPEWQPNGNILMLDNHNLGPEDSSRAIEISIDFDRDPVAEIAWQVWGVPYAGSQGDADRLLNGNTMVTLGREGVIFEVNDQSEEIWRLTRVIMEGEISNSIYRAERIPNLYSLAFTLIGPDNGDHVPDGESFFAATINNIGNQAQAFRYNVTDSEGWFEVADGYRFIEAGESSTLIIHGQTPEGMANDTLYVEVYPISKPSQVDSWTTVVQSDENMQVDSSKPETLTWRLLESYPNPFNSITRLNYGLPETGLVSISVYDITGRLIETLIDRRQVAGYHSVTWNAKSASSGLYIVRMKADGFNKVQKIVLTK